MVEVDKETQPGIDGGAAALANDPSRFFNRELGWLQFNRRVLGEALSTRHPLLERVKFLAIFSSNMDEFFMVRVSGIHEQIDAGVTKRAPDGLMPSEQLALIRPVVDALTRQQHRCWSDDMLPRLRRAGVMICTYEELSQEERTAARELFDEQVFPVLTPLA